MARQTSYAAEHPSLSLHHAVPAYSRVSLTHIPWGLLLLLLLGKQRCCLASKAGVPLSSTAGIPRPLGLPDSARPPPPRPAHPDVRPVGLPRRQRVQQVPAQLDQEAEASLLAAQVLEEASVARREVVAEPVLGLQEGAGGRLVASSPRLQQAQHLGAQVGHAAVLDAEVAGQAAEELRAGPPAFQGAVVAHELGAALLQGGPGRRRRLLPRLVRRQRRDGAAQRFVHGAGACAGRGRHGNGAGRRQAGSGARPEARRPQEEPP